VVTNTLAALQNPTKCSFCRSANLVIERRQTYQELTCKACLRVNPRVSNPIRIANKSEAKPPAIPAPSVCGHCDQLARVLHELEGVNRELRIIVRAVINGAEPSQRKFNF
jgi:hypothetical protein